MRSIPALIVFQLFLVFLTTSAWAGKVKDVRGKKVLVDMESDSYNSGDILKILTKNGKTVGLIKITKTKGQLAEGLLKGKAQKGLQVKLKSNAKTKTLARRSEEDDDTGSDAESNNSTSSATPGNAWGAIVGMNATNADVKTNTTTVSLKGTGFNAMGFLDYAMSPALNVRAMVGMDQLKVSSTDTCTGGDSNGPCNANITYLSMGAWGRYLILTGGFRPWVGGGVYMMFPMAKTSTALKSSSITNTSVFGLGGGFDLVIGESSIIPVQIEYDIYPSSESVKASAISARVGFGIGF